MKNKEKIIGIFIISSIIIGNGIIFGIFFLYESPTEPLDGYIFTDSVGRLVNVPNNPKRIISMSPSVTEILYELEVDEKLVGVTDYCNYPSDATNKTSIGGFSTPNLEVIVSLYPDLIITANWDPDKVSQLESLGFPVVVILSNTLEGIIENIGIIGNLTNANSKGLEVMNILLNNMTAITNETNKVGYKIDCYFEVWETPKVAGSTSFINHMIEKAGAINIFGDIALEYPTVSHESVISRDPDVIFITEHSAPWYSQNVCDRTGYNVVNACINARVYSCFDDIYLRQGPRIISALENMTNYLYPSLLPW